MRPGGVGVELSGENPAESGLIRFLGSEFSPQNIHATQHLGIAYVTDDRLSEGLFMEQDIFDNILIANLGQRCCCATRRWVASFTLLVAARSPARAWAFQ